MEKFQRKIFLGFFFMFTAFIPFVVGAFYSVREMVAERNELVSVHARELLWAERLRFMKEAQFSAIPAFVLSGDPGLLPLQKKSFRQFNETFTKLQDLAHDGPTKKLLIEVRQLADDMQKIAVPGIELRRQGRSAAEVNLFFEHEAGTLGRRLNELLDQLVVMKSDELRQANLDAEQGTNQLVKGLAAVSLIAVAFASLVGGLVIRTMRQKKAFDEKQNRLFEYEKYISQARKETVEVVAHDLKSPLSTIRMSLEMMAENFNGDPGELAEGLQIARRSTESMERLIDELLDHAKIEAGQLHLERVELDLELLTCEILRRFGPLAKAKNVDLTSTSQAHLPSLHLDLVRIEQVISNLLGNALKFTPAGGRVVLALKAQEEGIVVSISDNGSGISSALLPHVFDRFWQVRATAKFGTGLGLAIAKAVVDAHQGRIWVESEIGRGTTFFVLLPFVSQVETSLRGPLPSLNSASLGVQS